MKKTNFFDAEFECKLLRMAVKSLNLMFDEWLKILKITGFLFFVMLMVFVVLLDYRIYKLDKALKSVQQEQVQMSCEMEANKMGVGYTFINKGEETECLLHYVD